MSFKLGGTILEDLVVYPPETKRALRKAGQPVPAAAKQITASEKNVLLAMASYADDNGRNIYVGRERQASIAICGLKSVDRAITRFLDDGVLEYDQPMKHGKPVKTKTRCYRIHVGRALELYAERVPEQSGQGRHDVSNNGRHDVALGIDKSDIAS